MELSNDEILIISGLLIKLLKNDIEQKNINEQKQPEFIEFKDIVKRKRGRPLKQCISSER
jgi:hypothetical protein